MLRVSGADEREDGLDMRGLWEEIEAADRRDAIRAPERCDVARQGGRIAAHIDDPARWMLVHDLHDPRVESRARWVHDEEVRRQHLREPILDAALQDCEAVARGAACRRAGRGIELDRSGLPSLLGEARGVLTRAGISVHRRAPLTGEIQD